MKDLASKFYMSENRRFFKIPYGHLKLSRLYSFVISTIKKNDLYFFLRRTGEKRNGRKVHGLNETVELCTWKLPYINF
jgi:hypothetical protein